MTEVIRVIRTQHAEQAALPIVVEQLRVYGQDRAYVRVGDTQAGFRDLRSGAVRCTDALLVDTVISATQHLVHLRS